MGFRKTLKRLGRKVRKARPGKDKYKKTSRAVKDAYKNPTDMGTRAEAAGRLSVAPIAGSQYIG